ncbi:glycoside hydrolase family 16 protein [Thalassotalea mangrovi]|uniref:Glycoside hydrolase family 16 protein n=1 Tax=Thalassotalea mangrovi TaxID=2572245 RepID=A0A4U1BA33_9GAMM|nr:glycoside hydrolase family 16 protein [Thalassotalea mangrovi]TKB47373.1 glycoside hydrolase family 16 protein [Thalassotalea mangrovi]
MNASNLNYKDILTVPLITLTLAGCSSESGSDEPSVNTEAPIFPSQVTARSPHWQLLWQDEFDGAIIDSRNWQFEQNCWGGGNNEQQCYTNRAENAFVEAGFLHIVARKESFTGPAEKDDSDNYLTAGTKTLPFTSARLRSKGLQDWRYGRVEVRAKLPQGQGTWPAIWMLPTGNVYGSWAASGEIDIMEAVNLGTQSDAVWAKPGDLEKRIHGTLHYGGISPDNVYNGREFVLNNASPWETFHTYAIEWQEGEIRWYMDDVHYATQTRDSWYSQPSNENGDNTEAQGSAPFDQEFHLLLNLAIGGDWAANTNEKGIAEDLTEARLIVDFVRVYQCSVDKQSGRGCEAISEQAPIVTTPTS